MHVGNFYLTIPEGRELESGHVAMSHGDTYAVLIVNNDFRRRVDAEVKIDGKSIGLFRVNAGDELKLERPRHDTGKFTFYRADSTEAEQAGGGKISRDDRGLVEVTFKPEKYVERPVAVKGYTASSKGSDSNLEFASSSSINESFGGGILRSRSVGGQHSNSTKSTSAGMTGLSGKSGQSFYEVASLDYDTNLITTITLRLIVDESSGPRELTPATTKRNPVPSPV